ncbi:MAG: hypothetical protein J6Q56_03125 [Clostridia bacterium]|nr:hypothetical protein [Clostridia bacterium]
MSNKKSETLKQREAAQRELIRLKKMQAGELETEKKEETKNPETVSEKLSNFLYYNKYKLLAAAVAVIAASYFIYSAVTAVHYDAKAVIFCFEYFSEENRQDVADYLEEYYDDIDGNGQTELGIIDCSFVSGLDTAQYANTMMTKIQSVLAGEEDAMLFLLDEASLQHLNSISQNIELFAEDEIVELSNQFYDALGDETKTTENGKRYLCLRSIEGTTLEGEAEENYNAAKKALQKIRDAQ